MEATEPRTFATDCTLQRPADRGGARREARAPPLPAARGLRPARGALSVERITLGEVKNLVEYEKVRESARAAVIALKKRPPGVGGGEPDPPLREPARPCSSRSRRWCAPSASWTTRSIQDELDAYNALLPARGELSATLFIEIPELVHLPQDEVRRRVNRFQGLDRARDPGRGRPRARARALRGRPRQGREDGRRPVRPVLPEPRRPGRLSPTAARAPASWSTTRATGQRAELTPAVRAELLKDLA